MDTKNWWQSRTIIGAGVAVACQLASFAGVHVGMVDQAALALKGRSS